MLTFGCSAALDKLGKKQLVSPVCAWATSGRQISARWAKPMKSPDHLDFLNFCFRRWT
jgi:hypothetical protein